MNTIKLNKGIIHLMLPFRLGSVSSPDVPGIENDTWTKSDEGISKFDFLLEHVKKFFTNNFGAGKIDFSACLIMKLKNDAVPFKIFNNKTYLVSNKPFGAPKIARNIIELPVTIDPGAFRMIYHPYTGIALLIYSIELVSSGRNNHQPGLSEFIRLNYLLRLFNRHDEAYFISQNERPEERSKAALLVTGKGSDLSDNTDKANIEHAGWRPGHLIGFLLNDLYPGYKVEFFNQDHFYPVCYLQPDGEIVEEEKINLTLFYLRKVYDFDYSPAPGVLQREGEILHPYKQIYFASSLEGAVVLNNCSPSDPEFVKAFYSNSFRKSLWLAILGLIQRSIFLQLMKEVSDIDPDDHNMIKEYLKRYTSITLKAIFSKVSVYHQHNDFYDLIIHNLQVNELQTELKDELHELNTLQRQFHEDEVERHEEIEKQYDKKLNMILFALSIFGLTQVTYAAFGNPDLSLLKHSLAIGIPLILGFVFWRTISTRRK